jgi:hypothetical protein
MFTNQWNGAVPVIPNIDDCTKTQYCEQIYHNLKNTSGTSFLQDASKRDEIITQLKQQVDYIYAKRYGKKRIG